MKAKSSNSTTVNNRDIWEICLCVFLAFLSLISIFSKIILGLDQDEQSAYTVMYRFISGDLWFADIYDPSQIPALLMAPIFSLCRSINIGKTVLLFRLASVLITGIIGYYVYKVCYKYTDDNILSILVFFCWWTITPKFIIGLDHSHLDKIAITLILLEGYEIMRKEGSFIRFGIWYSLFVVCYPTMAILVIPLCVFLFVYGNKKGLLVFLSTCIVLAAITVMPTILKIGWTEFVRNLGMMTGSVGAVRISIFDKLARDAGDVREDFLWLICFFLAVIIEFAMRKVFKKELNGWLCMVTAIYPFIATFFDFFRAATPFKDLDRYLVLAAIVLFECIWHRNKEIVILDIFLICVFFIALKSTSNGMLSMSGYITSSAILFILLISKFNRRQALAIASIVIASQCVVSGVHYRQSGTPPTSIFNMSLERNNNYLDGMYVEGTTNEILGHYDEIEGALDSENLIFLGKDIYFSTLLGKKTYSPMTNAVVGIDDTWKYYIENRPVSAINIFVQSEEDKNIDKLLALLKMNGYVVDSMKHIGMYRIYFLVKV